MSEDRSYSFFGTGEDPEHLDKIFDGDMKSEKHLIGIGSIIIAFNKLDEIITTCFSIMLGCEPELASILAYSLPVKQRCDLLFHIFAYRFGSAEIIRSGKDAKKDSNIKALTKLFKKIEKAGNIRNSIVHSSWTLDEENDQKAHRINWKKSNANPGFPSTEYEQYSADDILNKVEFIDNVRKELYLFLWDNFGVWFQERARNHEGGMFLVEEEDST